jgi:uncharacterized protein YndB with AHSA1/START domain
MQEENRPPEDEQPLARPAHEQRLARPAGEEQEETPQAEEERQEARPAEAGQEEKGLVGKAMDKAREKGLVDESTVEKIREKGLVDKADRAIDKIRDRAESMVGKARDSGLVDKIDEAMDKARNKLSEGQVVRFEASVEIEQPPEKVFDYVADPENLSRWVGPITEVRDVQRAASDQLWEGDNFTIVVKFLGRRFEMSCEVINYLSNRQFSFRSTGGPVPQELTYTFEPTLEGTHLTHSVETEPGTFFRLTGPLFEAANKRQINNDLATLKDLVESEG